MPTFCANSFGLLLGQNDLTVPEVNEAIKDLNTYGGKTRPKSNVFPHDREGKLIWFQTLLGKLPWESHFVSPILKKTPSEDIRNDLESDSDEWD